MKANLSPILRPETEPDHPVVEQLTREAFWNLYRPGCDEHYLAHILRSSVDFIPELDYVAVVNDVVIGNIMYAHSRIKAADGRDHAVITFGPVSVLPEKQSLGIGKALITHTLGIARELGHRVVVIYGDPLYYCRFGFEPGENYGIRTSDGMFSPALQVLELVPGAMEGISGQFHEADVYRLDPAAAEEFDKTFEPKELLETPTQKRFMDLLSQSHF